jgi:hypothetical protein
MALVEISQSAIGWHCSRMETEMSKGGLDPSEDVPTINDFS